MIPRDKFFYYMKQILTLEAFNYSSIFDKTVFCLGEKQGMLINDECSSWYNRVGDFFNVSLGWEERNFIWQWISSRGQLKQPPLLSARSMAQSATTVECG